MKSKGYIIKNFIEKHRNVFIGIFIVWVIFFASVIAIATNLSFQIPPSMSLESLGIFGDSFNVLTSLFTGFAFAGVIISVILQTQELKEARIEFTGQKEALQNQEFDNRFFQMLNLLNNITENFNIDSYQGKDTFKYLKNKFQDMIQHENYPSENVDKFLNFQSAFDDFNNLYDTTFKYYFINLYQILKYINMYIEDVQEAKEYTNMLRAQLTKNQLVLLAYNAIGVQNFTTNDYQQLVEKYSFFEHLRYDDFCENENIIQTINKVLVKYADTAFGKNQTLIDKIANFR